MNRIMMHAFFDEMEKIALFPTVAKPAPVASGVKSSSSIKSDKPSTNYSVVNAQPPPAPLGVGTGAKALAPPVVRS